ncbi:PEGA domain-containing protein [Candidatus Fermentibacteria bacterium]|nr:PEGA domain-containing protein [Candidatus Fermentibacteria bacterium]
MGTGKRRGKLRKSTIWVLVLTAVLVLQIATLLLHQYLLPSTGTDEETGPDKELLATVPVEYTFNDGATVEYERELSLWFPPCEPAWEDTIRIYRLHNLDPPEQSGEFVKAYTAEFATGRQPSRAVRVEMSIAEELEEGTVDLDDDIYVMYFDDETGDWREVATMLDRESQRAVFYAEHFSGYVLVDSASTPHPMMRLHPVRRLPSQLQARPDTALARDILQLVNITQIPGESAIETGVEAVEEAFGITSTGVSFANDLMGLPILERFNSVSGEIGVVLALTSFSIDIFQGDDDEARMHLSSSLLQYSLGQWLGRGMKIANIGIFMINYSLTEFGQAALDSEEREWRERYQNYNRTDNQHNMNQQEWIDFVVEKISNSRDVTAAIDGKMHEYLWDYFDHDVGSGCPRRIIDVLVAEEKARVCNMLTESVEAIQDEVRYLQNRETLEHLNEQRLLLNDQQQIRVCVYGDSVGDPKVRNLPVRVVVEEDHDLWEGITDDAGQWWMNLTWIGYIHYGKPTTVELEYEGRTLTKTLETEPPGRFATVRFYLEEARDTLISVTSEPSGATIYLDGANTGKTTPAEISDFQPGTHQVRVYLEGYNEYLTSFDVAEGESHSVHADLGEPQPPLPVFETNLSDGDTFTDNVITVSGTISLLDEEGNTSTFQGSTAILNLNGADREIAVENGQFSVQLSIPSGPSVVSMRANSHLGDTGVSEPVTIHGDFSVPDIEVTLTWNTPTSDIDLHVYNPEGEHCCWTSTSISDGFLDIDDTQGYGPETFTADSASTGTYTVQVNSFDLDEDSYSDATITINVNGQLQGTYGPHRFSTSDNMEGEPAAWWDVTTIDVPAEGQTPEITDGVAPD